MCSLIKPFKSSNDQPACDENKLVNTQKPQDGSKVIASFPAGPTVPLNKHGVAGLLDRFNPATLSARTAEHRLATLALRLYL